MSKFLLKFFYLSTLFIFCPLSILSQTNIQETIQKTLKVGVAGSEPFVFAGENKGIAVEIWDEIADKKSWDYEYVPYENIDSALHDMNKGHLDLVVGPVSITSKRLNLFTIPVFPSFHE